MITGCASGISLATVLHFARDLERRFKVYATMECLEMRGTIEKNDEELIGTTLFL